MWSYFFAPHQIQVRGTTVGRRFETLSSIVAENQRWRRIIYGLWKVTSISDSDGVFGSPCCCSSTPFLFASSVTAAGIGSLNVLGPGGGYGGVGAAITTNGQMDLSYIRPANDAASDGVTRAFLRVWPVQRRRAAGR
jgi:hypothetical protein